MHSDVRVRFAPSPTGMLHLGGLRMALYDYIYARQQGGTFILRIEDTDQTRFVEGAFENVVETLAAMGIDYDEGPGREGDCGPYVQSQRLPIYRKYIDQLVASGHAYPCFCSKERIESVRERQRAAKQDPRYDGLCRSLDPAQAQRRIDEGEEYVVRLAMPQQHTFVFYDKIRGKVEIDAAQVDDQVILKSDGFPTYHLAVVVDDHLMRISHVFRGEEWLPSAPKHIFLYEALGWKPPIWVHMPLILSPEKGKLSKRHGDFSVSAFRDKGYLREALVNFVALLGWHPKGDEEIFGLERMVKEFSFKRVNKAGAVFDITKLDWMNGQYLRSLPLDNICDEARPFFEAAGLPTDGERYIKAVAEARGRVSRLEQIADEARVFFEAPRFAAAAREALAADTAPTVLQWWLAHLDTDNRDAVNDLVKRGIEETGVKGKRFYFPVRLALYGSPHGPDIPALIDVLGIEEARRRFQLALDINK
ncbi:MAG: glutamate--tRNA ligase [Candidatus Cloacimonetes bacterium]|nr:glutamate--tRNA ligase [Candidatus Cloacimonadota bacterium]